MSDKKKKRGFQLHPELINRNGRPKKGETISDILNEKISEIPEGQKVDYKTLLIERWLKIALNSEDERTALAAIKEMGNRLEGMPKVSQDINMNNPQMDAIYKAVRDGVEENKE